MSVLNPINLFEFIKKFLDEEACRKYLFHLRWPPGFSCPRGGNVGCYYLRGYQLYQCADCDYQASVTAGTIMPRSHTSLSKWFIAIYLVATDKRGCSALTMQRHIKVNYQTAWLP